MQVDDEVVNCHNILVVGILAVDGALDGAIDGTIIGEVKSTTS